MDTEWIILICLGAVVVTNATTFLLTRFFSRRNKDDFSKVIDSIKRVRAELDTLEHRINLRVKGE